MWRKLSSALGFVASLVFVTVAGVIGKQIGKEVSKPAELTPQQSDEIVKNALVQSATQLNAKAPITVDEHTRLVRAVAGPGLRFTYVYSLPEYSSQDFDSSAIETSVKPVTVKNVCSNKNMVLSLKHNVIFVYTYVGSDLMQLANYEVTRADCGL